MSKEALKEAAKKRQNGQCGLSGEELPDDVQLMDTHRKKPKAKGGKYEGDNFTAVDPVAHQEEHGTRRDRPETLEELKAIVDDRNQVMGAMQQSNNRLLAADRNVDVMLPETRAFLTSNVDNIQALLVERSKWLEKATKHFAKSDPLCAAAMGVGCIGPVTVAYCRVYIDAEKARHASSVWKYAGLHCASHERYTKGEATGGNKRLRTALYNMAESQIKGRGPYRYVYDAAKENRAQSETVVKSRNTQGKLVDVAWGESKPCHRHGHGIRMMMKHFLADWWYVARDVAGLDTSPCYAESVLKNGHRTVMPEERGWIW
jgi:hypothetical protein